MQERDRMEAKLAEELERRKALEGSNETLKNKVSVRGGVWGMSCRPRGACFCACGGALGRCRVWCFGLCGARRMASA